MGNARVYWSTTSAMHDVSNPPSPPPSPRPPNLLQVSEVPTLEDGSTDYSQDFFGKPAFLTVSGQVRLYWWC